ncbi:succinate dehydrogenase, hydrophobic membrane anchor protein [Psychromarinibacter sp. C21-152]|uniref:Succinate dehydrogenase hydrophobic membrane anchor subunit n=1 Tax=Psychromarinibacter sediminicola TaxID=3033385 RepID=A0AAE3NUF6_9RHOB|nr:succinate dehydrogenase, hydrophobic membrane anchor protein [Psychromarinibacter sediminicola]MDF0602276.1 succinate dehydrogenase, hydrophobic membrane anchor protein [Psychromarinibacter sediminicola]
MRYLTARKRAEGKGAAHAGTEEHWYMTVSGVGLAFLIPAFLFIFGRAMGSSYEVVVETFSRPIPAIVTGLTLVVGLQHFIKGCKGMIEDYAGGSTRKILIIAVITISYFLMAAGIFALAKLVL